MMMMMMMMNFFENCSVKRYFKSRPLSEIFTTANLRMYLAEIEPKQILSSETVKLSYVVVITASNFLKKLRSSSSFTKNK